MRLIDAENLQAELTALEAANKVLGDKLEESNRRIEMLNKELDEVSVENERLRERLEKGAGRKPCIHGKVCRAYMSERKTILTVNCPGGCMYYEPVE